MNTDRDSNNKRVDFVIKLIDEYLIWIILLMSLIFVTLISSSFFSKRNLINLTMNATVLGILVIAESLCLIVGKFDISIESTLAFSALIGALMVKSNVQPFITIITVLAVGTGIGLINAVFIVKVGVNPFMQTLSMNIIFRGLMLVLTKGVTIYGFPKGYRIFGDTKILGIPTPIILLIALYAFFIIILQKREWGRRLYATGSNERAAFLSGVNVDRVNMQVFILAGLLSAFAGLVVSTRFDSVINNLAKGQVFEVFAAAVMGGISLSGGRGKLLGAFGGVLFLGCITSILTWLHVSPFGVQTTRGCIILFAIVIDAIKIKIRERVL